ncbi:MAG: NAD(P)-dependent oxidoreductase [Chloroflexota bacterium]|nr:NAD(P)-dependent oxidoreductase [Chloroflexota bacterium]
MRETGTARDGSSDGGPVIRRVLITGAEGTIGTALREYLGDRYALSALTKESQPFPSHVADISDLDAILPAFDGVEAVVHLAASPAVETPWPSILQNNLIGTYNVFEAAHRAGVERVVFASSNHVIGMYEFDGVPDIYALDDPRTYDHTVEIRPDSLYGVSKVYGEALGRYYVERHGLKVFCLRIGSVRGNDDPLDPEMLASSPALLDLATEEERRVRMRATWQSRRDIAQLVGRCLDVPEVTWAVVYGISDNPRQFWDISHARDLLGYEPQDGAPE